MPTTTGSHPINVDGEHNLGCETSNLTYIKCEVMVNWLRQQQLENMWSMAGLHEGVVLKTQPHKFISCPASIADMAGGLFDAIRLLNVKSAMTVKTRVISLLLKHASTEHIPLPNGLKLQIVPTIAHLPNCQQHQSAALVRDASFLVVWHDDPKRLLEKARSIESQLMDVIWTAGESWVDYGSSAEDLKLPMPMSNEDCETIMEVTRPLKLNQAIMVAATVVLSVAALGAGWRQIAIEVSVDRGFLRLVFAACVPFQLWLAQFFMQSIIGSFTQCLGPVRQVSENSRFFSAVRQPRIVRRLLPHVTIQCPVYKESLKSVIEPSIRSIKTAISTYEMQGGTANIFVNDDGMQLISKQAAQQRREFYEENHVGWVARPPDQKELKNGQVFRRAGKFKKASNMNHALAISSRLEEQLYSIYREPEGYVDTEKEAYASALESVLAEEGGYSWAEGNIRIGDYILLVDSDTRVPSDCLFDACNEMECAPRVALIQFRSGVMNVTDSYFEHGITFFTNLIYTAISFAVACGDVAPFVGHNAILRWSAVQDVAYASGDGEKYWSEETVSEDFDMALRLQARGYDLRYADYFGDGFKEGVSLTVYDELLRWEKYAFGCAELIFHPVGRWFRKGPFTSLFRRFLRSSIPLPSKITIMAYVGTYYAIGSAWILTIMNYFIVGWYNTVLDHYYIDSFRIFFSLIVVFTTLGNFSLAVLRYRLGTHKLLSALWENMKWIPLLAIFLGGLSMHVSWAIVAHLLSLEMSWGSTAKELVNTTLGKELRVVSRNFCKMLGFCLALLAFMAVMAVAVPPFWRIDSLIAIFPLGNVLVSHVLLPLILNPGMMLFSF